MIYTFIKKTIICAGFIVIASTTHAMQTPGEVDDKSLELIRKIITNDKDIVEKDLFYNLLTDFINKPKIKKNKSFLPLLSSFTDQKRVINKSLSNFIMYLISRIKISYPKIFEELIKTLPDEYVSKHLYNWLRSSLKSAKEDYFNFFLNRWLLDPQYSQDSLTSLFNASMYQNLKNTDIAAYNTCKETLNKHLKIEPNTTATQSKNEDSYEEEADEEEADIFRDDEGQENFDATQLLELDDEKEFKNIQNEAKTFAQKMVETDTLIIEKDQLTIALNNFTENLQPTKEHKEFLVKFSKFHQDGQYKVKSLYNFFIYLLGYRICSIYKIFPKFIKTLPETYIADFAYTWLITSLKSGKTFYFTFVLTQYGHLFDGDELELLFNEDSYAKLSNKAKHGYNHSKKFLLDYLKSREEDSESDVDQFFIVSDSESEEELDQLFEEQNEGYSSDSSDNYKLFIIDE